MSRPFLPIEARTIPESLAIQNAEAKPHAQRYRLKARTLDRPMNVMMHSRGFGTYLHPDGGITIGRLYDDDGNICTQRDWGTLQNAVGRICIGNPPNYELYLEPIGELGEDFKSVVKELDQANQIRR